ncbi:lysylphosphatidylglycerol synthase transmembrane domain-containing protein [Actinomyces bowdenii]|uniref:Flippase-like domain-containing protein n=1 Tax=Actinomyces bowdenii TaxID=131109 RepID=A0A853EH15_9ACTO|nr:lysylphosphatidylglycerol synthase transmembrane domain-containing protein [Actinomyces bowdenii]MBF0696520.1 flippase-like domain-containing protein [Actinomyces bowdenii]NYS68693.1 flippase-like domain-containing protein [Actinomyces bowdenii]
MTDLADGPTPVEAPVAQTPATSPVGIPAIGVTAAVERRPAARAAAPTTSTLLVDAATRRLRRTSDLLDMTLTALGIGAVLILAIYAHQTTTGVTQDVQNALAVVLRQILVFPLQAMEGLATFIIPLAVLLDRLLRRAWRSAGEAALAGVVGFLVTQAALAAIAAWGPAALISGLTVTASGSAQVGVSAVLATLAGLLTGAGDRHGSTAVRSGWATLWVIIGMAVLRSALTLPGAILSVLLGRLVGLAVRYAFGVEDRRAHGPTLVRALRRAGIDAVRVVRMDHAPGARAWTVTTTAPLGYTEQVRESPLASPTEDDDVVEAPTPHAEEPAHTIAPADDADLEVILAEASSAALSHGRDAVHRLYAVWDSRGQRRDVTVLDADRQMAGFLSTIWDQIRIKGLSPNRDLSLRPAAEHAALMTLEARRALVRTPGLMGMAEAEESVLLVTEHVVGARSIRDLGPEASDRVLAQLWDQLRHAHAAGLAHGQIDASSVVIDAAGRVWLLDWNSGETISSELSRRVDLAQALALTALTVGVERAIAAASRSLSTQQLASIAPMLQRVVLPRETREAMGRRGESRQVLQDLRDALVALTPTAHAEPAKLARFSPRTVIMAVVATVAIWTVLAQLNFEQVSAAVAAANVWWILAGLIFSLATYVGAGLTLAAFSPQRLSVWKSTEVHLASSVVALVAPAGVGGAAINLRFLQRKGVPTATGVATVALVQVVQFVVTVILLIVLAATTGQSTGLTLPSGWLLVAAGLIVILVAGVLMVPQARTWVWAKIEPTYRQVWPRLVWVMSNPMRLAVGIGGAVVLTLSYILSFSASLWAFGYTLPFSVLAITYLASNTVGSVVPSPGGIGPVELALTAGLVAAGIPSGVALSTAIVYRLVTFWVPIPVGWLSLQRLQRAGDL